MYGSYLLFLLVGIVFGSYHVNAETTSFPYHVEVLRIENDIASLQCFGAIVHRRYVLTSAQCVEKNKNMELVVRFGGESAAASGEAHDEPRAYHRVLKTYVPKEYSYLPCRKNQHDLAILRVRQCFDLVNAERYKKVNMPGYDNDYERSEAEIAAYRPAFRSSLLDNNNASKVHVPEVMPMSVLSNEDCQRQAGVIVTEGSLCAQLTSRNPQDRAFLKIGGPLVYDGVVIGLLSDEQHHNENTYVYTRVSVYLDFINSVLKHENFYSIFNF